MAIETRYFKDNFFSAGRTEIFTESKDRVGELDLKSMFSSGVDVLDLEGNIVLSGKFPFMGFKWKIFNKEGQEIGSLKRKFSFFSKIYEYHSFDHGYFNVTSKAFSRQYEIFQDESNMIANFDIISGFFSSHAYKLTNFSDEITTAELIAVVMGVNAIERRRSNSAAAATS